MNDQSIAWMMSGGIRTETREQHLQSIHRRTLDEAAASPHVMGGRPVAGRGTITSLFGRKSSPTAAPTIACCAT